jgi:hypothetical protein
MDIMTILIKTLLITTLLMTVISAVLLLMKFAYN